MCGRIRQAREAVDYGEMLRWNPRQLLADARQPRYNVPPGTRPIVLHRLGDGSEQADNLFWGYKPVWSDGRPLGDARLDTILTNSRFWKPLLGRRVIVPADGWYEWTGDKGDRQPWYINPKDGAPILMAGITAWASGREVTAATGFSIITDNAAGGMVDLHDRRPICLTPDDALAWLDPQVTVEDALELLSTPRPESAFQWWRVTRAIGNSRYQMPDASTPI